jgi:hypothetical protein
VHQWWESLINGLKSPLIAIYPLSAVSKRARIIFP